MSAFPTSSGNQKTQPQGRHLQTLFFSALLAWSHVRELSPSTPTLEGNLVLMFPLRCPVFNRTNFTSYQLPQVKFHHFSHAELSASAHYVTFLGKRTLVSSRTCYFLPFDASQSLREFAFPCFSFCSNLFRRTLRFHSDFAT